MSGLNSPHDNLPDLQGDIYTLEVRLDHAIEHEGEEQQEIMFTSIQPSKEDAYKRLVYVAETEWQVGIDEVLDYKHLEGSRDEQLAKLLKEYEERGLTAPESIVDEFVQTMEMLPEPARKDNLQSMPDILIEQLGPKLPDHLQRYLD